MDRLQQSIIRTVAYFDIFHHPMKPAEIRSFLDMRCSEQELNRSLAALVKEKILFRSATFYQLKHDDSIAAERIKANALAEKHMIKARKIAAFLACFPFIKGIAVSGSLSKKIATVKSDYDFFIITQKNCLWLSRFMFSVFIKAASLVGLKKYFCLNYIIDESYLEVEEKNIFTAIETVTLMPMYGGRIFTAFFAANNWAYDFFPNHEFIEHGIEDESKNIFTRFAEWLMYNKIGQKADDVIMHFFEKRWRKLKAKKKVTGSGFMLGSMMVDKHYCKPYPQHFQREILLKYEERIANIAAVIPAEIQQHSHLLQREIIK
ncbi:MAG: hypothetical protein ABI861_09150 [Panacibacter sp.]